MRGKGFVAGHPTCVSPELQTVPVMRLCGKGGAETVVSNETLTGPAWTNSACLSHGMPRDAPGPMDG